jgi:hypothetical protein
LGFRGEEFRLNVKQRLTQKKPGLARVFALQIKKGKCRNQLCVVAGAR